MPRLSLDRPFTYLLSDDQGGGTGSLVSVPFHGRTVSGWVLGPAAAVPRGKLLPVRKVRSPVRFFDGKMLELLGWVRARYISPLATVIERAHPPRVVGEEGPVDGVTRAEERSPEHPAQPGVTTWLRPLPGGEATACVGTIETCVAAGNRAILLVPEAEPLPATARAVLEAFGDRAVSFLGGDGRAIEGGRAAQRGRRRTRIDPG